MNNKEKFINLLKYSKGESICILPHDNADVDAILSSILFSKLLDFLDIKNEILIFDGVIGKDTLYILDLLDINITNFMVKEESDDRFLFLLDHNRTNHAGKVIGCFDHHPTTEIVKYSIYENKNTCATACIIFEYMKLFGMPIDKEIVEMLAYAMLVDTTGFTSSKTVKEEALALPKLLDEYDIDFNKIREISCLYTDIYNMSIDEVVMNGLKTYNFKKGIIKASYCQIKRYFGFKMRDKIIGKIIKKMENDSDNIELWIYIAYALDEKTTYVHYIYNGGVTETKYYAGILSRGIDIMPAIEKEYN